MEVVVLASSLVSAGISSEDDTVANDLLHHEVSISVLSCSGATFRVEIWIGKIKW